MNTTTQSQIEAGLKNGKVFRGLKLPNADFTSQSLKNADFRGCSLVNATFVKSDLTYANFEGANCCGADFTDAICHRTSFKDCDLSYTILKAKDLFGITVTLECKSFTGMQLLPGHWAGWLLYGLLMKPPSDEARDRLILAMGVEYWEVLKREYAVRQW